MSFVTDLKARKAAIGVELAALATTEAGGLPNASVPHAVDHVGYKDGLYRELDNIHKLLLAEGGLTAEEMGIFEVVSEGST